jgi:nicotinate-nucleotide adenylyltransferase
VSTIELEAPDRPFTFETVERLQKNYGERAHIFFVMGADSFEEITEWREPARLMENADLIVAARPGHQIDGSRLAATIAPEIVDLRGGEAVPDSHGRVQRRRVYLTDYVKEDVSSREIRRKVRDAESIAGLVPPRVVDYIEKYELYRR